jgi:hypothetical protein
MCFLLKSHGLRPLVFLINCLEMKLSMEHWWNDSDRGNWSTERKTLYSVGSRWVSERVWRTGRVILTGKAEVLGGKYYTAWVVDEWMVMEHRWNDTVRGKWNTGRQTLYSVGGRWVSAWVWGTGRMMLTRETEVLGGKLLPLSFEEWIYAKFYLKIQFVPRSKHTPTLL